MKLLLFSFTAGLALLYFMNLALLKSAIPNLEWSIHAGARFLIGFFVLGVSCFYFKKLTFKHAVQLTLAAVVLDYLYDYYVEAYRLNFEIILHGVYMLVWGALMGYLTWRYKYQANSE
ncbi:hypothetical protein [Methylomonas sp. DH-1]|uniref:hypothetical protein n=1 Tax=Methylomonas sp. (strain DH-1) TaxID=1727196 RepID=UPI0007C9739B|nr:hypothetical protein [Methylomonas sp. DH-1]ANE57067.1 hypothetical protein AYM39_19070 [Methylomonas sp. DH-1]